MNQTDQGAARPMACVRAQAAFESRTLLSNGEQLLVSVILPALALVGMVNTSVPDLGAGRRIDIVAPGVLALAVVSTAFTGQAIATAFDRRYGLLRLLGVSPLGPRGLLAGKAIAVLTVIASQVVVLGGLAAVLGWRPQAAGLPAALVVVVLGAWVFVCLALAMAGAVRAEGVLALANLIWVLLVIGGGLLFSTDLLPGALATVSSWLPWGALGDGLRTALFDGAFPGLEIGVLLVWGLMGTAVVARTFRWSD
ncbi:ABC transporter permease [Demetria terragena]|uniref:ABC transporter permease n=1 Tax=Demetria terragena TaxID=63959 RepID=UPI00037DC502|nr:ABC transporter permease [Demetria terragena]